MSNGVFFFLLHRFLSRHDVWAQLPPEIVYEQFRTYPYRSSPAVIVGAEKNCWPFGPKHPACTNLPQSPLPLDVYGELTDIRNKKIPQDFFPATDKTSKQLYNQLETIRPRFINSGSTLRAIARLIDFGNLPNVRSFKTDSLPRITLLIVPLSFGSDHWET